MGQKVNPISNRLGVIRGWDSNWYGGKKYGETLLEDSMIRKYLRTRLAKASVSENHHRAYAQDGHRHHLHFPSGHGHRQGGQGCR